MHTVERVIKGFQITDLELTVRQREKKYEDNMKEEKKKLSRYIFEVMKKLNSDGPHCIMAAHHFGYVKNIHVEQKWLGSCLLVDITYTLFQWCRNDLAGGHWVAFLIYP
jgi:hypothetical protein